MNSNINISFSSTSSVSDGYWVKLYQEVKEEPASMEETVALVDSVFDLVPCVQEDADDVEPVAEDKFKEAVAAIFDMNLCYTNFEYSYLTNVIVDRSDISEPYTLRLTNGVIGNTVVTEEALTEHIDVSDTTSASLKYAPVGEVDVTWGSSSSDTPDITVSGKELSWEGTVTGSITAVYESKYEVVEITVFGTDDSFGDCTVIAFYHGGTDELDLQPPKKYVEDADLWKKFCLPHEVILKTINKDSFPQWVTQRTTYKCECSGDQSRVVYENEPDFWDRKISTLLTEADNVRGSSHPTVEEELRREASQIAQDRNKSLGQYTFPGVVEEIFGGYEDCGEVTGDINKADFYKQNCCEQPAVSLPNCKIVYRANKGGKSLDKDVLKDLTLQYADKLKVVPVSPPDGDCGIVTTKQLLIPRDCCDFSTDIVIDTSATPDILPAGESITLYFAGGQPPYLIKSSAANVSIDGAGQSAVTYLQHADISATEDFCGATEIRVEDSCSMDKIVLRSSEGDWYETVDKNCQQQGCNLEGMTFHGVPLVGSPRLYNGQVCIDGASLQLEYIVTFRSDTRGYNGGIQPNQPGVTGVCPPGVLRSVCTDSQESLMDQHCACASAAGMPVYAQFQPPSCGYLAPPIDGTDYFGSWPWGPYSCDGSGGGAGGDMNTLRIDMQNPYGGSGVECSDGSHPYPATYRAEWYVSQGLLNFKWMCK